MRGAKVFIAGVAAAVGLGCLVNGDYPAAVWYSALGGFALWTARA